MLQNPGTAKTIYGWGSLFSFGLISYLTLAPDLQAASPLQAHGEILGKEGSVDFTRTQTNWTPAIVGQELITADRLRTMQLSRALLQLAELGRVRVNELTTVEVLPPPATGGKPSIDLKQGAIYFFTREKPREFRIQTPHALALSDGTEFLITIEPGGRVVFTVFDGRIELSNPLGNVTINSGEQGAAQAGQPPVKLAAIEAVNIVQWWLYYPGVLDTDELPLTAAERNALLPSLNACRQGDLLAALQNYPAGRVPQSDADKLFYASLLLAVGQVDKAEAQVGTVQAQPAFRRALEEVIAAVTLRDIDAGALPGSASEWLARSYLQQSKFNLRGALASARNAAARSTNFGFAWARVAELEFSFRRTDTALKALSRALALSPRNAQAFALKGFLEAANNHLSAATNAFQTAIDLDSALGNGWLGRGLVRLRQGDSAGGRSDFQTAAAMEPNRSVLRSYLGKAFDQVREESKAEKELDLAKRLDSNDPTPWLYSALLLRQQLRFNEALDDLERSVALNDNRRVYRSRLLLDEDRAVRSSSLATIYQSAGMNEVSVREAARAVVADYANPSAHLFLAESFNALRDPTRFNLRFETAWFNELLLANILAPVGGGNLSQNISQQEYSRMFATDGFGFSTFTEGRTDGQVRELASQYGTFGDTAYALDLDYQHNDGVRANNELNRAEWYTTVKHQITAQDSVLVLTKYQDYQSGDNFQYYNPKAELRRHFGYNESEEPFAVAAYHREWAPGIHTLLLGGRLEAEQRFEDRNVLLPVFTTNATGRVVSEANQPFNAKYRNDIEIFTSELNQIFQTERFNVIVGGRFQTGDIETKDLLTLPPSQSPFIPYFPKPPAADSTSDDFERYSAYGYYTLRLIENLYATVGMSYDRITFPQNFRAPPISSGTETRDRFNPKGALVWSAVSNVTFRGVYSRALGGVTFDESFRLEPVQLAGFNQAFRTIIPESIAGSVAAPTYEVTGGAMDVKLPTRTYFGVQGEALNSEVRRTVGSYTFNGQPFPNFFYFPSSIRQRLDYDERSVVATVNQLLADEWSVGARYRYSQAELQTSYPLPRNVRFGDPRQRADLHQATLFILFNHRSGVFASSETDFYHQDNLGPSGTAAPLPSEDFVQQNFFVGYRFKRQRGEISVGVLNVNDTDYRLNPLNVYSKLPRDRTFIARLKLNL